MHPLKKVFNKYVHDHYGVGVGGDKNEARTELVAQKVLGLGLDYDTFVEVACSLWHRWAEMQGWKYPYWNLISSDKTMGRVEALLGYVDTLSGDDGYDAFAEELAYALDYIWWYNGADGDRPRRGHDKPSADVVVRVSEYICATYGLSAYASDYNVIASLLGSEM